MNIDPESSEETERGKILKICLMKAWIRLDSFGFA